MRWTLAKMGDWLDEAAAFWRSYGPIFVVALEPGWSRRGSPTWKISGTSPPSPRPPGIVYW